jgi:hypothetical protein
MGLFNQLRSGIARRLRRSTTLVVVGRPEPLPGPRPRRALPAPKPAEQPRYGGGGFSAYGRSVVPDPYRQQPMGRGWYDPRPLLRGLANPWQHGGPDVSEYRWDKDAMLADLFPP